MSELLESYRNEIDSIVELLKKDMGEKCAKFLAVFIVLCEHYGKGDAYAGFILRSLVNMDPKIVDDLYVILKKYGIEIAKPKWRTHFSLFSMVSDATKKLVEKYPKMKEYLRGAER